MFSGCRIRSLVIPHLYEFRLSRISAYLGGPLCVVRRTWIDGKSSEKLKTKRSRSAVRMAAELAQFLRDWRKVTAYGKPTDWVFVSAKTHGRTPRVGNMLVAGHLRPAAIKAG